MSDKTERTKEEILENEAFDYGLNNSVKYNDFQHQLELDAELIEAFKAGAKWMEEYRQSSPVESPDEFAMKFLEYASGLVVSNYKSGGSWYLSDGRIVKTADILKQFKSELEEPKEK